MDPKRLIETGIGPALRDLEAHGIKDTREARRFLLAIALQESGLRYRRQVVAGGKEMGPASSFYQFERGGGCRGILAHRSSAPAIRSICAAYNVDADETSLW